MWTTVRSFALSRRGLLHSCSCLMLMGIFVVLIMLNETFGIIVDVPSNTFIKKDGNTIFA
jgi:hypothetical protein